MKYFYFDCDVLFSILRGIRKKKFFKPYFRSLKNARKKCTGYLKDYYVEKRIARFEKRIFFLPKFCFGFKRIISKIFLQEMGQSSRMSWTKILEQIVRKEKRILLQTLAPRQNLARLILKKLLEILFSPCIIRSNLFRTILKKKNDNA
jgi:hypothetical protein